MTKNVPAPIDSDETPITRDNAGRFVKGVSGNPAGRPKGAKNRATLIREGLTEASLRQLSEEYGAILAKAIELAKDGNEQMIRMFVKDLVGAKVADDEETSGPKRVNISIKNLTVNPSPEGTPEGDIIDGIAVATNEDS